MRNLLLILFVVPAGVPSALALTTDVPGAGSQFEVYQERSLYQYRCGVPNEV